MSYLGTAVMFVMVFGVLWQAMPVPFAQAAPTNGDAQEIALLDTNANGTIDQIKLSITNGAAESWQLTGSSPWGLAVKYSGNSIDLLGASLNGSDTANPVVFLIDLDEGDADLLADTAADNFELTYTQGNGGTNCTTENCVSGQTIELNTISTGDTGPIDTELDKAKPVILSTTPSDSSTAQSRTNSIVWNFSEPMATGGGWTEGAAGAAEFEATPDPGNWGAPAWSNGDKTVTISHGLFLPVTQYTLTTDDTQIAAAAGESGYTALDDSASSPIGVALVFTTISASQTIIEPVSYDIELTSPNGGEEITAGEEYEITWDSSHVGMYSINLYYLDASGAYQEIASGVTNNGSYMWTVPADVDETMVKVAWDDLAEEFESDSSDDFFMIIGSEVDDSAVVDDSDESDDDQVSEADEPEVMAPSGTGISPVTGEEEEITEVAPGDFISSPSFSTVYYVNGDYERQAFISSAVYFTYADSYDEIKEVTDATLSALDLGANMLPNPGVVLVKVQSDPKTYAVDEGYELRWITSEAVAIDLYGEDWADYIIDVEATFISGFSSGNDVDSADDITVTDMKTREEVSQ